MTLRTSLAFALVGSLLAITSACRTSPNGAGRWNIGKADPLGDGPKAWQVECDELCSINAKAVSLDALCSAVLDASSAKVAQGTRCTPGAALGVAAMPATAVRDAAVLDLVTPDGRHHGLLALQTAKGWALARSLGNGSSVKVLRSNPVDVPGIEPAGVEVRVAVTADGSTTERLFVCGLAGDGSTQCPLALTIASDKGKPSPMAAGMANVFAKNGWRAEVTLTSQGYSAKAVSGNLPSGLAGDHGWGE